MATEDSQNNELVPFSPDLVFKVVSYIMNNNKQDEFLASIPADSAKIWISAELAKLTKSYLPPESDEKFNSLSLRPVDRDRCRC